MNVQKGQTVRVVGGTDKIPAGTTGVVFWKGDKGYGERVGLNAANGATYWVDASAVMVVDAAIKAVKTEAVKGQERYWKTVIIRQTAKAYQTPCRTWWPKSQCYTHGGFLVCSEWLLTKKYKTGIPAKWLTETQMAAYVAAPVAPKPVAVPAWKPEPFPVAAAPTIADVADQLIAAMKASIPDPVTQGIVTTVDIASGIESSEVVELTYPTRAASLDGPVAEANECPVAMAFEGLDSCVTAEREDLDDDLDEVLCGLFG